MQLLLLLVSGLVTTRPRQFCTPDITLAAHLLPNKFKIALLMYNALAGRCPEYINDIVAPVASNPGRKQLRSAARSDVIVPRWAVAEQSSAVVPSQ